MAEALAESDRNNSFVELHLRRNLVCLGADLALLLGGMSFVSMATVLPAFAARLGASNVVIGAIPAVMTLGWHVPGVFAASYTERLSRKLPFILKYTIWERVPLLAIAVLALWMAESQRELVLVALLGLLAVMTVTGGVLIPAWLDLIGRVIPTRLRGRLFAVSTAGGGLLGMGAAAVAAHFLATYPFPLNYALCFLAGFTCMAAAFGALALAREPEIPPTNPPAPLTAYLRRLPAVLASHPNFVWFLAGRALNLAGYSVAAGFYTVYALKRLGAPEAQVGLFTLVFLGSQTVGNLGFGVVADRAGHKLVVALSSLALVATNLLALGIGGGAAFLAVFVGMGVSWAAINVSGFAILLEFASEHDRPTYVALGSLVLAPFALAAPLLGGWLADNVGYLPVFAIAAGISGLSALLLAFRVRDPRLGARG